MLRVGHDQRAASLVIGVGVKAVNDVRVLIAKLDATLARDLFDRLAQLTVSGH